MAGQSYEKVVCPHNWAALAWKSGELVTIVYSFVRTLCGMIIWDIGAGASLATVGLDEDAVLRIERTIFYRT